MAASRSTQESKWPYHSMATEIDYSFQGEGTEIRTAVEPANHSHKLLPRRRTSEREVSFQGKLSEFKSQEEEPNSLHVLNAVPLKSLPCSRPLIVILSKYNYLQYDLIYK